MRIVINQPYINESFEIYTAERFAYVGCIEVDYRRPFAPAEGNNIKILYDIIFEKQTAESMLKKKERLAQDGAIERIVYVNPYFSLAAVPSDYSSVLSVSWSILK